MIEKEPVKRGGNDCGNDDDCQTGYWWFVILICPVKRGGTECGYGRPCDIWFTCHILRTSELQDETRICCVCLCPLPVGCFCHAV
ncbi:hypothetical protein ACROYT_G036150 [Oculina patagonica]